MTDRNSILWDLDEGKEFDARQELGKSPDKLWKCYCPVKSNFKKSYKVRTFLPITTTYNRKVLHSSPMLLSTFSYEIG